MAVTMPPTSVNRAKCGHLGGGAVETGLTQWSWDGDGLASAERKLWRSRRALVELVTVLLDDATFAALLHQVRSASDPRACAWGHARHYGIGNRRALIAALMVCGAKHDNVERAGLAMCNLGAMAVTSVEEQRNVRRSTYLIGDASLAPVQRGCQLLAQKGAGRALSKVEERDVRRTVGTIRYGCRPAVVTGANSSD